MSNLSEWGTFYQVLGSASATLTGLQFIAFVLLAEVPLRDPHETQASDAFATPTTVHFVSVLVLAAIGAAPWHRLAPAATVWGIVAVAGLFYTVVVIRRMRSQGVYEPVVEDWAFHAVLPALAYAALIASALVSGAHATAALITLASCALLLLLIGVHNAWDNLIYIVMRKRRQDGVERPR